MFVKVFALKFTLKINRILISSNIQENSNEWHYGVVSWKFQIKSLTNCKLSLFRILVIYLQRFFTIKLVKLYSINLATISRLQYFTARTMWVSYYCTRLMFTTWWVTHQKLFDFSSGLNTCVWMQVFSLLFTKNIADIEKNSTFK